MKEELSRLIKGYPCTIRMVVKNLQTKEVYCDFHSSEQVVSASMIKVPILIAVLQKVQKGELSLQQELLITQENKVEFSVVQEQDLPSLSLYELLLWMIMTSDNSATNVLIDVMGMAELNNSFIDNGMKNTRLERKMMDFDAITKGRNNFTSAEDCLLLFESLYEEKLLNKEYTKVAFSILLKQRDTGMLRRYIAEPIEIAHKGGELDHLNHDAGIVFGKKMRYFIGIFVTDIETNEEAYRIIGKLSKLVYDSLLVKEVVQ